MVPAEEVTNINTNPFTLGVAEAARCLGAVNFSNLDRYKFFSRLTSYLVIKKKNRKTNLEYLPNYFINNQATIAAYNNTPRFKNRCRETNLLEESLKKKYTQHPITFKFCTCYFISNDSGTTYLIMHIRVCFCFIVNNISCNK